MPELPEVETIRRDLYKKILKKKIKQAVLTPKAQIKGGKKEFLQTLKSNSFQDISRLGKMLVFALTGQRFLLIHLKMTGQLIYQHGKELIAGGHPVPALGAKLPGSSTRAIFIFADNSRLFFNDIRRFGFLQVVGRSELEKIKKQFGLEPFSRDFTLANFKKALGSKKIPIKLALLDQQKIAGLGNIYASEVCFEAKIKPHRRTADLSGIEWKKLFLACQKVIRLAIKNRGTTFHDYLDADGRAGYHAHFLKVYDRGGLDCKRKDGGKITKLTLGGRGTFYCQVCQK